MGLPSIGIPDSQVPAMPPPTWSKILAEARAGSADALGCLLDGFRPYLWVIAHHDIDLPMQAKVGGSDLVQESLINAYRRFDDFTGESRDELQAWLAHILRNVVANQRRRYNADRRQLSRESPLEANSSVRQRNELADGGETPSQLAGRRETGRLVRQAVAQLPAHYQEILRLRSEERRPFEEIARLIGRSPDGARMLWGRAIRKLHSLLDNAL